MDLVPASGPTSDGEVMAGEHPVLEDASEAASLFERLVGEHRPCRAGQRRGHPPFGHVPRRRWPPACRGRARRRQDEPRQGAVGLGLVPAPPDPVHLRPAALGRDRRERVRRPKSELRVPPRADLRQHRPRRRDQPDPSEDSVRLARVDGGAPGHRRRDHLPAPGSVHGHRHPEPARARGDLSLSRSASSTVSCSGSRSAIRTSSPRSPCSRPTA